MRGEDVIGGEAADKAWGSPPHARGRRSFVVVREGDRGITPRMRGEDFTGNFPDSEISGSPPHARGRRIGPGHIEEPPGITPACAGKTKPRKRLVVPNRDHPRMRGEDVPSVGATAHGLGSPPHARGRPDGYVEA